MSRVHCFVIGSFVGGVALIAAPTWGAQAPEKPEAPAAAQNAAEKAASSASEAANNAAQKTDATADKAVQSVDKAAGQASQTAEKTANQAGQAADRAGQAAENAANRASGAVNSASNQAGDAANRATNQAGQAADRATNAAGNAADRAGQAADRAADQAGRATDRAADLATGAANNAANQAGNAASRAANQAGQAADRAADRATGAANNAANQAGQAADRAADRARDGAGQATDQARDAAGRVINNQTDVNSRTNIDARTNIEGRTNVDARSNVNVQGSTGVQTQVFDRVFTGLGLGWQPGADALTVANLAPASPFAAIGLTAGDQLVSIAGRRIATQADFVRYLYDVPAGQRIPLVVMRNGVQQTLYWTPDPQFISTLPPRQEVFVAFAPQGGAALGIRLDERVQDAAVVADVAAGSPAERAGVRAGDAIVALNEQRIESPSDFTALAGQLAPGSPARMSIARQMDVELTAGSTRVVNRPIAEPTPAVVTPAQPVQPVVPRAPVRRFFRNR